MTAIGISAQVGLLAVWLLTANLLMGLLLSMRYNPLKRWPHRRVNYFTIHNWTGYIALALCVLHVIVLPLSNTAGWSWADALWPAGAPQQPIMNVVGAISLYVLAAVVFTSYVRRSLGRRTWKAIHYAGYVSAILFFVHGVALDPKLLDRPINWIDAEKVSIEVCVLLVIAATIIRVRWSLQQAAAAKLLKNWDAPEPVLFGSDALP